MSFATPLIVTSLILANILANIAPSYGAEAFGAGDPHPLSAFGTLSTKIAPAAIDAPQNQIVNSASFEPLLAKIQGDFQTAIESPIESPDKGPNATEPPHDPANIAQQFATDFAMADNYILLSLNAASSGIIQASLLSYDDIAPFASLVRSAELVRERHLLQNLFDEPYVIWPASTGLQTYPALSYHMPVTAQISYGGDEPAMTAFDGTVSLSFTQFEAIAYFGSSRDDISLRFSISQWGDGALLVPEAALLHQGQTHQTALLLLHTSLPNPAIWGQFHLIEEVAGAPLAGSFTNLDLPQ